MAEFLRSYLQYTFQSLTKYDYMAIGWILFLAFLLLILSVIIKKRVVSYILLLIAVLLIFLGTVGVKIVLDDYIRATEVKAVSSKKLKYSNSLIVEFYATNVGRLDFKRCDFTVLVYKPNSNALKKIVSFLKPIRVETKEFDTELAKKETKRFKIIVDHFTANEFNLTIQPRCYP